MQDKSLTSFLVSWLKAKVLYWCSHLVGIQTFGLHVILQ